MHQRHRRQTPLPLPLAEHNVVTLKYVRLKSKLEVGSGGQFSPSVWPHNPTTGFRPPSATVVSAELFPHGTGTLRYLQKEMATYRLWSVLVARPRRCPTLSNPAPDKTEWRLISATLCGRRRCLVADQLWFMTRIREEALIIFCLKWKLLIIHCVKGITILNYLLNLISTTVVQFI